MCFFKYYLIPVLFIFVTGCSKEKKQTEKPQSNITVAAVAKSLEEMTPTDVILVSDGYQLTKAEYDAMLTKLERQFRLHRPNANPALLRAYLNNKRSSIITEFANRALLLSEAEKRGIKIADIEMREALNRAAENFSKQGKTLDQMLAYMGDTKEEFERKTQERLLINKLLDQEFGENRNQVTDQDIAEYKDWYAEYNRITNATNELVMARGRKIIEELNTGADFNTVALAYTEEEGIATGYWGEFVAGELDDENVRAAAFSQAEGTVAGPFDTEEGLVIIKILGRRVRTADEDEEGEVFVRLGRIFLRMGENYVCPNDQELRAEIIRDRNETQMVPFLESLRSAYNLHFPNGTNFWPVSQNSGIVVPISD